jgi:adenylylsulfate kinase-like enzyme
MKLKNKNKGILFWITGVSGTGKTALASKIKKEIIKKYGPTLVISGDDIRKIFELNKYDYKERLIILKKYCKLAKFITNQKINLIFAVVGMIDEIRKWNRKNIDNYVEIYLKSDMKKIINFNKKKIYHQKNVGKIIGVDIQPELPKKPDIIINNNFDKSLDLLSKKLFKKISKII